MKPVLFIFLTLCGTTSAKAQSEIEIWYWKYTYDYATSSNSKEVKHYRTTEIYNNNEQLIETRRNFNKDLYDNTVLEYNDAGQKIKETDYYGRGSGPERGIIRNYTYNEQGLLASLLYRRRDPKGDTIEIQEFYFYEGNDLVKKLQKTSPYNRSETWEYTYEMVNGNKRVTESHTLPGGRKKKKRIKEYNEKNLLVLELGVGGYRTEYSYTYDTEGNWVTKKVCVREGVFEPWKCGEFRKSLLK